MNPLIPVIFSFFMKYAVPLIVPAVVAAIAPYIIAVLKKVGINVDAATLKQLALDAIQLAEETAAQVQAKGQDLSNGQKLEIAIAYILGKYPSMSAKDAAALVHANLPESGFGATAYHDVPGLSR